MQLCEAADLSRVVMICAIRCAVAVLNRSVDAATTLCESIVVKIEDTSQISNSAVSDLKYHSHHARRFLA